MSGKNLLEQAAATGATPSAAALEEAGAVEIKPEITAEKVFDPTKFTNPADGKPFTFRDGSIFDPATSDAWPRMNPDGSPNLTVDGFLRKTNSGKNKSLFDWGKKLLNKIQHPQPDEVVHEEQVIEEAAQAADQREGEMRVEATRQAQLESRTNAASIVALSQTIARAVGGAGAGLSEEERKFLEGSVYRYELTTGRKLPLPPEVSLFGDFAATYGAKFEKEEVRRTANRRFGFFKNIISTPLAFVKGMVAGRQQPAAAPAAPAQLADGVPDCSGK